MDASSQKGSSYETQPLQQPYEAGDLIISYLEQLGVEYIFGIPGGAIEPLYNALARSERRGGPRAIVARHETGAAFMADGYSRETGKLGVCCATTGPGATNMITGVASAYQDNIPMLVITAQTPLKTLGKGAFQESSACEVNTVGMYNYCTKSSLLVTHKDQLEGLFIQALMTINKPPKGPVHLSIPSDIFAEEIYQRRSFQNLHELINQTFVPNETIIENLFHQLIRAKEPVFVIGNRCADAIGNILELCLLLKASVLTTPQGKGLVSSYHPQLKGVFGFAGHDSANEILKNKSTDLVIAIGTSLSEWESSNWDEQYLLNDKLIHIDGTNKYFARTPMARMHVSGDLPIIFDRLLDKFYDAKDRHARVLRETAPEQMRSVMPIVESERRKRERRDNTDYIHIKKSPAKLHEVERRLGHIGDRRKKTVIPLHPRRRFALIEEQKIYDNSKPIKPQRLMQELSVRFPANTRFFVDTGNSFAWATHYLHPTNRRVSGQRNANTVNIRVSMEFSSMGWAIGAAIGTARGNTENVVVCITGDGSFLMSGQEFTVAVQEKLAVIYIILNDHALGMVKHGQQLTGAEHIGYDLSPTDFSAMAHAMGGEGYVINSPRDFESLDFGSMCNRQGPTLLDVRVDPSEIPPMAVRVKGSLFHD